MTSSENYNWKVKVLSTSQFMMTVGSKADTNCKLHLLPHSFKSALSNDAISTSFFLLAFP